MVQFISFLKLLRFICLTKTSLFFSILSMKLFNLFAVFHDHNIKQATTNSPFCDPVAFLQRSLTHRHKHTHADTYTHTLRHTHAYVTSFLRPNFRPVLLKGKKFEKKSVRTNLLADGILKTYLLRKFLIFYSKFPHLDCIDNRSMSFQCLMQNAS
jgi:hypothetical protein